MSNNRIMKKKKKTPFNAVDVIIALFLVLYVAYVVYVLILGNSLYNIGAQKVAIEYEIEIKSNDISIDNYENIQIGDVVRSHDGANILGKVVAKYSNADGSASIVIKSDAFLRNGVYKIDGVRVYKKADLEIRFPDYAPKNAVKCIGIKVV